MIKTSVPLLSSLLLATSLHGASIINPSFENGLPVEGGMLFSDIAPAGWVIWSRMEYTPNVATSSPDWIHSALTQMPGATQGSYFVSLDSYSMQNSEDIAQVDSGIRSTVSGLTVGDTYTVSFDSTSYLISGSYQNNGFLDVYAGAVGATLVLRDSLTINDLTTYDSNYAVESSSIGTYSFSFTATATQMDIGFRARLDDPTDSNLGQFYSVSLDNLQVIPEPSSMALAGAAVIGAVLRRRRI